MGFFQMVFSGAGIALLGGAIAAITCGVGSAKAVGRAGSVAVGVMSEKPELYGKLLLLQALPGTQGIYGLLVWFFIMLSAGFFSGASADLSIAQGLIYFVACLPMTVVGYVSAIFQGNVAADGVLMVSHKPEEQTKALTMSAMVETFAILALLASVLSILSVPKF